MVPKSKKNCFLIIVSILFSSIVVKAQNELIFQEILKEVNTNAQAYNNLKMACTDIGPRLTGSTGGQKAEKLLYDTFKSYGFEDVKFMPFDMNAWSRNKVSLTLVPDQSDNYKKIDVVALANTPISAHVNAKIIDCGDGLKDDFEKIGDNLKGKIALFNINIQNKHEGDNKNLHRSEKTALAIQNGAVGVIISNSVKGGVLLTGTASVTGDLIPIPAVCISYENGLILRKWIRDEKNILGIIDMQNYYKSIHARNVVATLPGASKKLAKEKIIVGGHLDSWDLAQGAIDNGLGAFSVLEIARVFKKLNLQPKRSIQFILFMGEEQGLLGSRDLVKKYKNQKILDDVKLAVNLDMANNTHGFNSFGREELESYISNVGLTISKIDSSYKNQNMSKAFLHSDHQSFMLEGIPVLAPTGSLSREALNCYHADCDSFDLVNEQELNKNIKYTSMVLFQIANEKDFPVNSLSGNKIKNFLEDQGLKEELILGKDWRWGE